MKKTIVVYGLFTGTIIITSMIWGILASGAEREFPAWLGYLIMIAAMTLIFIGVKRYRDRQQDGVITFGRGFVLGLGIALLASFIYVAIWEAYLAFTDYAFIHDYTDSIIKRRQEAGLSGGEMQALVEQMQTFKTQYANPAYRLPMTFAEIFPVGFTVALISAATLRFPKLFPARR